MTCQGSIQLVTALAVVNHREREAGAAIRDYEDHLVIYDLYAPPGQVGKFADFVRQMASLEREWASVVYIDPERIHDVAATVGSSGAARALELVRELVGVDSADEIYLCRNWQFGNNVLINAYRSAKKICYGDSIGIYFSEAYFSPAASASSSAAPSQRGANGARGGLGRLRALAGRCRAALGASQSLKTVEFDAGYFLLPYILGEVPPMKTTLVGKEGVLAVFEKLGGVVADEYVEGLRRRIGDRPVVVLMTSNFSEAQKMPVGNELAAYREFLAAQGYARESVLVVKPHPRDDDEKIRELRSAVGDLFSEVILLTEAELFFVPFEILLMRAFLPGGAGAGRGPELLTFSTACLAPKLLFDVKPVIGFGDELVEKFFNDEHVAGRVRHEHDLRKAMRVLSGLD